MHISLLAALSTILTIVSAGAPVEVRYDTVYDTSTLSTLSVACSDGVNGLYTAGYKTLGALPNFPNIGAAVQVAGWNSPQCGKCYKLYYNGKIIYVTTVDHAGTGFVLSKQAMDTLTGGQAQMLGAVNASFVQANVSFCKM
ncbi:Cerato-platanin [Trichophaea hybrida]|nr:Cerato-platanin [Trichophaea hybrida]